MTVSQYGAPGTIARPFVFLLQFLSALFIGPGHGFCVTMLVETGCGKIHRACKSFPQALKRGHIFNDLRHD
jgi:hypothetical protein